MSGNFNDSENRSIPGENFRCGLPPFFPVFLGIPDEINKIQGIIAILTAVIGLPLNIYLLVIITKFKSLHQRSLLLSLQIIVIEIIYHMVIPLTIFTSSITGEWVFGQVVCNMTGMIHDAYALFRFSMTFVLTFDRFMYIFGPFFYSKHGGKITWCLSSCMWILTIVRVVVPLYGILDCYIYIPTFKTCTIFSGCSVECENFTAASIAFIVFTGVALSLVLYIIIFIKVKKIAQHDQMNAGNVKRNTQQALVRVQQNKKILMTVFFLMLSIAGGTAPAFTLYIISLFYRELNATIFITNMLIGRTFFNLIPVFDAIAFTRHRDIKAISSDVIKSLKINFNTQNG